MKPNWYLFLLLPFVGISQNTLFIEVAGTSSTEGMVRVALYREATGFLKFDRAYKEGSVAADQKDQTLNMDNLPNGRYALAIFHDTNGNGKLDTNWLGIPKEAIAFSKGRMKAFGPPDFWECSFEVLADTSIRVLFP